VWKSRSSARELEVGRTLGPYRLEALQQRFAHEARSAAEVHHEHLVPILAAGEVAGRHHLAVGYVPGRTLLQVASG
jgi:hypothetical protein